jgi:phosphoribosylanthranilate isomerase
MSVKVKICGLTNLADAQVAVDAGADYIGFIFHPKSPRYITPAQVTELLAQLRSPAEVYAVGVFVNMPVDEISAILDQTGLHFAQLHGDEPAQYLAALAGRAYKAVRPISGEAAQAANVFTGYPKLPAPQLLLDAYHPNAFGGTGHQTDWQMAATVAQNTQRLLLAGGLTAGNVQAAITTVSPWGVDVASGVEAAPGRKDHNQVRAFIANAHGANVHHAIAHPAA